MWREVYCDLKKVKLEASLNNPHALELFQSKLPASSREQYVNLKISSAFRDTETLVNNHSRVWSKILKIGKNNNQQSGCKDALLVDHANIPVLQGLRKDHNPPIDNDPIMGPKLRPLCAANKSTTAPLGNCMAKVVRAATDEIAEKTGTEIINIEEQCRA